MGFSLAPATRPICSAPAAGFDGRAAAALPRLLHRGSGGRVIANDRLEPRYTNLIAAGRRAVHGNEAGKARLVGATTKDEQRSEESTPKPLEPAQEQTCCPGRYCSAAWQKSGWRRCAVAPAGEPSSSLSALGVPQPARGSTRRCLATRTG